MEGHGHRGRHRPRRRRPDDGVDFLACQGGSQCRRIARQPVADVDRRAGVLGVFNFSIGQGRAVVNAPVDRLQAAIDKALLKEAIKGLKGACFIIPRKRAVGLVPAPKDANAFKLAGLQIDILLRIGAAGCQHLGRRHLQLLASKLLVYLDFNRQSVAIEARHIRGIVAGHGL